MAAAIIPIIAAALPLLQPLIEKAVLGVEHALGLGTGPTKMASVDAIVTAVANALSTAGKIPGTLDATTILTMIETVVQHMKANGQLPPTITVPTNTVQLPAIGQTFTATGTLKLG